MELLSVKELWVKYGNTFVVRDVSFSLGEGETLGVVGESGSGKSVTAMSILRLLGEGGVISSGEILLRGRDILKLGDGELRNIRGGEIAMIFQEPMTSLNPVFTVGRQIIEPLILHRGMNRREAKDEAIRMLRSVRIPNAEAVIKRYPHTLSGGMRQRVMIAMALASRPRVLIADEPTTALDVTVEAGILDLIREVKRERGTSVIFITHDLGVVSEIADRVLVMYLGRVLEDVSAEGVFGGSEYCHPYTEGLLRSLPSESVGGRLTQIPGSIPNPRNLPHGCPFAPRCQYAVGLCREREPELTEVEDGHFVRCYFPKRGVRANDG